MGRIKTQVLITAFALLLCLQPAWADSPLVNLIDSRVETVRVLIRAKNGLLYEKKVKQLMFTYLSEEGTRVTRPYKVPGGMVDSRDFKDKMGELKFNHPYLTLAGTMVASAASRITVITDL